MVDKSLNKNLKGAAGVHFVVAQLSLRGYVALPTTRNLKAFDIIAFKQDLSNTVFLQVKSTDQPKSGWHVYTIPSDENWQERLRNSVSLGDNFVFIFVELPHKDRLEPLFYIVPSRNVAEMVIKDTEEYLNKHERLKPGKQFLAWSYGGVKSETNEKYLNRWELLDLSKREGYPQ